MSAPGRELVDLYDDDGRVVGQATRARVRGQNLQHAATAVLVRNARGEVFVHRRTDTKDVYPGLFDVAAGGVIEAGEDPQEAAAREAFEELGVRGVPLRPLGVARYADEHTRYLAFCFEAVYEGPIRLQPEEVAWGAWLPVAQALAWLTDDDHPFVPDTTALLLEHLRHAAGQEADPPDNSLVSGPGTCHPGQVARWPRDEDPAGGHDDRREQQGQRSRSHRVGDRRARRGDEA